MGLKGIGQDGIDSMYMVKYRHKPLDVRNTVINIKVCGKEEIS
jgi:hypothetical protein